MKQKMERIGTGLETGRITLDNTGGAVGARAKDLPQE
jgi:hypothetical protein